METTPAPKKLTKAEQLTVAIQNAKNWVAKLEAELGPKIKAQQDVIDALQEAYSEADKASSAAYHHAVVPVGRNVAARLFPEGATEKLVAQVKDFVAQKDLPHANVNRLVSKYMNDQVARDPEYIAVTALYSEASAKRDRAQRKFYAADRSETLATMVRRMRDAKDQLDKLETMLARLPGRRASQRDTRREQKLDILQGEQTKAAKAAMDAEFVFKADAT